MKCPNCKREYEPDLVERKQPDKLVQIEFPDATATQREQLLTGICSDKCWDEYLGPER